MFFHAVSDTFDETHTTKFHHGISENKQKMTTS